MESSGHKHPSYGHRPIPSFQLLAKLSKFNGTRHDSIVNKPNLASTPPPAPQASTPVVESSSANQNLKTSTPQQTNRSRPETNEHVLDPNYNPNRPTTANRYKYNAHMNTSVGKILHEPLKNNDPLDPDSCYIPGKRISGAQQANRNNSLIGGVTSDGDPFMTVTQQMQSGIETEKKSASRKKPMKEFDPDLYVSPITGEQMANYGTWAEDLKNKKKPTEQTTEIEIDEDPIMAKLKAQLASRGAKGIIGLGRLFKIMDDDGSNSLSFQEFKKAMREIRMGLDDAELIILFKRFDISNAGAISYNDFLTTVAGSLNKRRRHLVNLAFNVLDKDKSGEITLDDIAVAYNCSKHPDVISGRKTSEQVLLEFLDGFDVGGVKDGKVTREEFERYYSAISASIPADNYFELCIRNAFHLPGGEGESANSSNLRVLATFADGSQRVVVVEDDLGLNPKDKPAIIARLKAQGLDVISVSANDSAEAPPSSGRRPHTAPANGRRPIPRSTVNDATPVPTEPSAGLKLIIEKIKKEMAARGSGGFVGLQRRFRIMDDDGSKSLNLAEFKKAMKELKLDLSESDLRMLFKYFDKDDSQTIDFEEFIQGVRDPLNERRLNLVHRAFAILDKDASGIVDAREIATMYDASKHPEVIAKRKTANQVLKEFLETFDVGGVKDGQVTREEFVNYYTNISASIENDDYFALMICNAWRMGDGEGEPTSSANMKVLVTNSNGEEITVVLENDLGVKRDDISKIYARLRAQGLNDIYAINGKVVKVINVNGVDIVTVAGETAKFNSARGETTGPKVLKAPPISHRPQSAGGVRASKPIMGADDKVGFSTANSQTLRSDATKFASGLKDQMDRKRQVDKQNAELDIVGNTLLDVLKVQLLSRGKTGIIELQRKFIEMDSDGSKSLDFAEFKAALVNTNLAFSEDQASTLFRFLDRDGSGSIDYHELLFGLRGPISPKLLVLVHRAFDRMDAGGKNVIAPQNLVSNFAATRHPDVAAGVRTSDEVMQEFLDTFDVGGVEPGKITREEFVTYYHNLIAAVNDDSYMELVVRRTWGLGEDPNVAEFREKQIVEDFKQANHPVSSSGHNTPKTSSGVFGRIRSAKSFGEENWGNSSARPTTSGGIATEKVPTHITPISQMPYSARSSSARSGIRGDKRS